MIAERRFAVIGCHAPGGIGELGVPCTQVDERGVICFQYRSLALISVQASEIAGIERICFFESVSYPILAVETHGVQASLAAHTACLCRLGTGYSFWVVDARALRASEDLNKRRSICAEDR